MLSNSNRKSTSCDLWFEPLFWHRIGTEDLLWTFLPKQISSSYRFPTYWGHVLKVFQSKSFETPEPASTGWTTVGALNGFLILHHGFGHGLLNRTVRVLVRKRRGFDVVFFSPFFAGPNGNRRNTVSRVLFRRRELTEPHWVLGQTRWVLRRTRWVRVCTQIIGWKELTEFAPRNSVSPKKLTEFGVWNRTPRNRIRPVSDQNIHAKAAPSRIPKSTQFRKLLSHWFRWVLNPGFRRSFWMPAFLC